MQWQLRLLSIFSNTTISEVRIKSVCFTATNTPSSYSSHRANIAVRKQSSLHSALKAIIMVRSRMHYEQ